MEPRRRKEKKKKRIDEEIFLTLFLLLDYKEGYVYIGLISLCANLC